MAVDKVKNQNGFTLIELVIVLAVIAVLVSILVPVTSNLTTQSKLIKANKEVEVIGLSVIRLMHDLGQPCLKRDASLACTKANRVDLLESEGPDVTDTGVTGSDFINAQISSGAINWKDDGTSHASMIDQFVKNAPGYPTPADHTSRSDRLNALGWHGSYLSNDSIGPDPWGHKYLVNTVFASVASDAAAGTGEGEKSGGWTNDLFVISAGPNGIYETNFGQTGALVSGDDIIFVIRSDTY